MADPIMKMVDDMHHHVRWGAMYAVEELSCMQLRNYPGTYTLNCRIYHQKVLPALTKPMDDFSDSKFQVHCCSFLAVLNHPPPSPTYNPALLFVSYFAHHLLLMLQVVLVEVFSDCKTGVVTGLSVKKVNDVVEVNDKKIRFFYKNEPFLKYCFLT